MIVEETDKNKKEHKRASTILQQLTAMYKFIQKHDSEEISKPKEKDKPKVFKRLQINISKKRQSQRVMSSYRVRTSKNSPFRNQKALQTMRSNKATQKGRKDGIEIVISPNSLFDSIPSATFDQSRVESRYFCENAVNNMDSL